MTRHPQAKYSVEAVANAVLDQAEKRGIAIGPMKLQKLLYLLHGYYLAATGFPLVNEFFEAWQYGPVAPSIYYAFRRFGGADIDRGCRAKERDLSDPASKAAWREPLVPSGDSAFDQIIDFVFDKYGDKSAIYLSDLTHKVGSPWDTTKTAEPFMRNANIPNEIIADYFKQLV